MHLLTLLSWGPIGAVRPEEDWCRMGVKACWWVCWCMWRWGWTRQWRYEVDCWDTSEKQKGFIKNTLNLLDLKMWLSSAKFWKYESVSCLWFLNWSMYWIWIWIWKLNYVSYFVIWHGRKLYPLGYVVPKLNFKCMLSVFRFDWVTKAKSASLTQKETCFFERKHLVFIKTFQPKQSSRKSEKMFKYIWEKSVSYQRVRCVLELVSHVNEAGQSEVMYAAVQDHLYSQHTNNMN